MSIQPISAHSSWVHSTQESQKEESLFQFFSLATDKQEEALSDTSEFEKLLQMIEFLDPSSAHIILQRYLIENIRLVVEITESFQKFPNSLRFFLAVIGVILKKGMWPWTPIEGKSFFGHLKVYTNMLPPNQEISHYLNHLDKDSLELFEEIVLEKAVANHLVNDKEKLKRLISIKEKAQKLADAGFPGTVHFIREMEEKIETRKQDQEKTEEIYKKLKDISLSEDEKIHLIKKECSTHSFLGYLVEMDDFEAISIFLKAISIRYWPDRIFKGICLEKAQNIQEDAFAIKISDTSEALAVAWIATKL